MQIEDLDDKLKIETIEEIDSLFTYENGEKKLDYIILEHMLVNSLHNFLNIDKEYPFVEKSELRPGALDAGYLDTDIPEQNNGLILYVKETLPDWCDEEIGFIERFRLTKDKLEYVNLMKSLFPDEQEGVFDITNTYLENDEFVDIFKRLVKVDSALLIQKDPRTYRKEKYSLTHCKVRIHSKLPEVVKELGIDLSYIKDKRDKKWREIKRSLEEKFYEYYAIKLGAGNRRVAASMAAHYLAKENFDFIVYMGSCQLRSTIKIKNDYLNKYCLIKLDEDEINNLQELNPNVDVKTQYMFERLNGDGIFIFKAEYEKTPQSMINEVFEKGEREFLSSAQWRKISKQSLIPTRAFSNLDNIEYNWIYK